MNAKQKAAQIYDQYWSAVSRGPVCKTDELPDMRPLLEQAIIEAVKEEREACAQIAEQARRKAVRTYATAVAVEIEDAIRARS